MKVPDTLTLPELGAEVRKDSEARVAARKADSSALQVGDGRSAGSDAVTASTYVDVDAAAPGAFAKDDYQSSVTVPPTTMSTSSFDQIFNDLKTAFMTVSTEDMNLAVAAQVREAIKAVDELQSLSLVIASEATKVSVAAAAGLLSPPVRADVEALKADGQRARDAMSKSSNDLRSGRARRRAARDRQGLLENNREDLVETPPGLGQVSGRVLESLTADASRADGAPGSLAVEVFAPQAGDGSGVALEGIRHTVADQELSESSAALQSSVLDKVAYLAICQALSGLDVGNETRTKAQAAYARLQEVTSLITKTLGESFNVELLAGVHELVADGIDALGSALQGQIDAWDQFLNTPTPTLPTLVSTVENIGDTAENVSFVENLLASCGLRMDSFCDAQGMLEVARSLDGILVFNPQRPQRLGRTCFTLNVPEPVTDYEPLISRPDREAKLLLAEAVVNGDTQVLARFSRADVTRALTTAVPQISGATTSLVSAGAATVTVSGLAGAPASVGRLRLEPGMMQEEYLRYASFQSSGPNFVFTLIDAPTLSHASSVSVFVDGEHRDNFSGVYQRRQEIGGGPGSLRLAGDNEIAETLPYTGSTFDAATGVYTFTLGTAAAYSHQPQTSGRPSPGARKVLFRDSASAAPAPRFKVTGSLIEPVVPGTPADMSSEIATGNLLVLSDDVNETPATVSSVNATSATLTAAYHNGNVNGVSLSLVDAKSAAGSTVRARFSQRALDELGIDGSSPSAQSPEPFQLLLDQDAGTRNMRRVDGAIVFNGSPIQRDTLNTVAPIFEPGDDLKVISVQSASGRRQVTGVMTWVDSKQVYFDSTTTLTGTSFSQFGTTVTGVDTKFASELQVGDFIAFNGVRRLVTAIAGNLSLTVSVSGSVTVTPSAWIVTRLDTGTVSGRNFSFIRSPRETKVVSSVLRLSAPGVGRPATDGLWELTLVSPSGFAHGTQQIDASATVQIIPQSLTDFPSRTLTVKPRFEPDVVPPGTLTLRGTFQDPGQAPILGPFLAAGGGDVDIEGLTLPYSSLAIAGDEVTVTLASPGTTRAFEAGTVFCVPTSSTVESILKDLFDAPGWDAPFESWFTDLDEHLRQLHRRLCRLLQGRPEDLAVIASAMIAGAGAFGLSLLTLRVTLELLLAGLGDTSEIDVVIDQARGAGMDKAADAMARGDVVAVAQMRSGEATTSGSLLVKIVAYREKLTTYNQSVQADSLAVELKGNQTSIQILAETRAGFKTAAASDITRKTEAAKSFSAKVEIVTS